MFLSNHIKAQVGIVRSRGFIQTIQKAWFSSQTAATFQRAVSVPGLNILWHVDGILKMIQWRLVTYGGSDSCSCLIVDLQCNSNIKSDTDIAAFVGACEVFEVLSHVAPDEGNIEEDI